MVEEIVLTQTQKEMRYQELFVQVRLCWLEKTI